MAKALLFAIACFAAAQCQAAAPELGAMAASDAAALEITLPQPPRPVPAAPADAQLIQRFDLVRGQLRALKAGSDAAVYEMRRLESDALRIGAAGGQHLAFQGDLMRVSSDMSRRVQEVRNAYYAVVNLLPYARKDRELYLRADEMDKAALSLAALETGAQRLESAVASVAPAVIGYTALSRAREISNQAGQAADQGRELRGQTSELAQKTRP
jgi:hypothetical protein